MTRLRRSQEAPMRAQLLLVVYEVLCAGAGAAKDTGTVKSCMTFEKGHRRVESIGRREDFDIPERTYRWTKQDNQDTADKKSVHRSTDAQTRCCTIN